MKVKIKANKLVDKFYYMLPSNGLLNTGINNCESRYNEAIDCAFIAVEEILFALKMDMNDPTSGSIRYWQEVKTWIQKIKDKEPDAKLLIEDMKAREYTSPLIDQLMSEITPEEMEETHQKMLEEDKKYKINE
jgi:hypothetical protein